MDKRFISFLCVAFLILTLNSLLMAWLAGKAPQQAPQEERPQVAQEREEPKPVEAADPAIGQPQDPVQDQVEDDVPPPEQPEVAVAPVVEPPARWATLGSADPASGYRMLVIVTSRGAAIEWIELSGRNFRDLEDESGYLGHLAPVNDTDQKGVRVRVVGPGTPAAAAGLQQDDVITAIGEDRTPNTDRFEEALRRTEPGQSIALKVVREGEPKELTAVLKRHPLQVVRPEAFDPTSLLLSLSEIDGREPDAALGLRDGHWELAQPSADRVIFTKTIPAYGLKLTKEFGLKKVPQDQRHDAAFPGYHVDFQVRVEALEGSPPRTVAYKLEGPTGLPIEGWWYANKISPELFASSGIRDIVAGRYDDSRIAHNLISAATIGDDDEDVNPNWPPVSYIGVDAQYFASVLIPSKQDPSEEWFASAKPIRAGPVDPKNPRLLNTSFQMVSQPHKISADGPPLVHSFKLFAGPKKPDLLAHYGMTELVQYGWFYWVARPMLTVLHFFYGIVHNYGLAIIMLTVLVRSCMFPLSRKQALGAQKMQQLQPEMKAIAEKYKKTPEQRMKAQQELFRKHKYNPLSGCFPLFIQMPIFIGLYRSLMVDVELRQAPLIPGLDWCSNLAAPDMLLRWDGVMPAFVVHFLGPYLNILPLVTVGLFLWQQKLFMPPPTDEQSALQQKLMRYMMIFMAFLFFKVASGLCLYFIASSLWGIAERKLLPKVKPAAGAALSVEKKPALTAKSGSAGNGAPAAKRKKQRGRK